MVVKVVVVEFNIPTRRNLTAFTARVLLKHRRFYSETKISSFQMMMMEQLWGFVPLHVLQFADEYVEELKSHMKAEFCFALLHHCTGFIHICWKKFLCFLLNI